MNRVSQFKVTASSFRVLLLGGLASFVLIPAVLAQTDQDEARSGGIEEILVTAQRTEQGIQDVPISVTALSGDMLEARQVINPSDLQLNIPNVSFTATNFGNSSTTIRGIGRLVISTSGESGVSNHTNEIPIASNQNAIEFFDVERIEVLRGPQGTLFGRNATGGAVNLVTKMPDFEEVSGFVDVEVGDYNHVRFKGAFNLPLSDNMAIRFAGLDLKRDGYITNLAYGQAANDGSAAILPNIDDDIDGRNLSAFRITGLWQIADNTSAWLQYNNFRENDDRARITNQICVTTDLPTEGCEPNEFGFEQPHITTSTGNLFAELGGALQVGARGGPDDSSVTFDYTRPVLGLRTQHTDFEPIFQSKEENVLFGMDIDLDLFTVGILAAYQETEFFSRQDYNMDVGPSLNATPNNPNGNYPTAQIPSGIHGDLSGPCARISPDNPGLGLAGSGPHHDTAAGTGPTAHPCIHPSDQTRVFSYDQSAGVNDYWTAEVTLNSNFDGRFNFSGGVSTYETNITGDYYVVGNTLDAITFNGVGGNFLYPGYFNSRTNLLKTDGTAVFGEVYFDLSDKLKITLGARYNEDNKNVLDSGALANSAFVAPFGRYFRASVAGLLGGLDPTNAAAAAAIATTTSAFIAAQAVGGNEDPEAAVRAARADITTAQLETAVSQGRLLAYYNTSEQLTAAAAVATDAATIGAQAAARIAALSQVPIVPAPGEQRAVNDTIRENTWKVVTGRAGIDWNLSDDNLVYAFYSRGYKPGGFNPDLPQELRTATSVFQQTFNSEEVDAVEIGSKNAFFGGKMTLNGSAFFYDYKDLQITRIVNNSSLNENIDAEISGVELEFVWTPFENLIVDAAYSYLDSSIKAGSGSIDPVGRTVGGADNEWLIFTNLGGAGTGVNYIARRSLFSTAVLGGLGTIPGAAIGGPGIEHPAIPAAGTTAAQPAVPTLLSRAALEAVVGGGATAAALASADIMALPADQRAAAAQAVAGAVVADNIRDGLTTDLGGNELPNSPKHTLHLGAAYTFRFAPLHGGLTLRWDYYWQSESFARDFNTVGDRISKWDQHNLSLTYNSNNGKIEAKFWMRNVGNKNNVTGHYLTSDTSGFYRNYFLTEPRIFGASLRYNF